MQWKLHIQEARCAFWFPAQRARLIDRWRYRSLALDGIKRECDDKLAEERAARAKARQMEDLRLHREAEAIRKERLEQEAQRQKSQVVERKQKVEPPPPSSGTSDRSMHPPVEHRVDALDVLYRLPVVKSE